MHVLFVCTGNVCRSPTAERLATKYGTEFQIPDFVASSAGIRAMIAHPMHPDSARVLENLGGNPSGFAARQLTPKIAASPDFVLTMTREHRDAVLELAPRQLHRTFTLTEAARLVSEFGVGDVKGLAAMRPQLRLEDQADIPDPIGQDPVFFDQIGSLIAGLLPPVLELCRNAAADTGR